MIRSSPLVQFSFAVEDMLTRYILSVADIEEAFEADDAEPIRFTTALDSKIISKVKIKDKNSIKFI